LSCGEEKIAREANDDIGKRCAVVFCQEGAMCFTRLICMVIISLVCNIADTEAANRKGGAVQGMSPRPPSVRILVKQRKINVLAAERISQPSDPLKDFKDFMKNAGLSGKYHHASSSFHTGILGEQTVYQYGGPETAMRCIAYDVDIGSVIKTCTQWATGFMQHGYYIRMYGPDDLDVDQLREIKDSCFAASVTQQLRFLPEILTVDTIIQFFTDRRPLMEASLLDCIKTTEILAQFVVKDFRLELIQRDFW
jgi:hypothetical protein